jgi:putative hemolysin
MKLIETDDLLQAAKVNGFAGESAAKFLMLVSRFNRFNKLYAENRHLEGIDFIDALIGQLGINYEVNEAELERIPEEGPFITISNHPFGGIDGLLLIKLILQKRPDYKVIPNFLLHKIEPVREHIFSDNPFKSHTKPTPEISTYKDILSHLKNGKSVGIFPASDVSVYNYYANGIIDREWMFSAIKLIKNSQVPVVPVYFTGTNSKIFHLLGRMAPRLQTVKLPTEIFKMKKKPIRIRIGSPIPVKEQVDFKDISRYGRYLRTKTYALGTALEVKKFFKLGGRRLKRERKIIDPVPLPAIEAEIAGVINKYSLFRHQNYVLICVPSVMIPNIMNEIGRLREITFRTVGEGTNQQMDIDEYDLYYHQLFIWDEESRKIVGAYRIGKGKEIMQQYGIRGFYIQSLFRMTRKFHPVMIQAMELGRSFIVPEYQKKPLPLFLLWKGILYFLLKNPEYRYLIGPVSISNRFSTFSKALIIKFIKDNYFNEKFARYVKPRKKFRVPLQYPDTDILFENTKDINQLDRIIKDIETTHDNMPVLLKKYLKQNGKIIEFNIDPKFNNALDGLMILDLFDVPSETISALSKEINDETILERFQLPPV